MILLTKEELLEEEGKWQDAPDVICPFEKWVAKAQLKKVVDLLEQKAVKAWGGNRVILSEDWQALLKECE